MLAARFADEFNTFGGIDTFNTRKQRVLDACAEIGRDPSDDPASPAPPSPSSAPTRRTSGGVSQIRLDYNNQKDDVDEWIASMRGDGWLIGTVDQVAEQVNGAQGGRLRAAGTSSLYR